MKKIILAILATAFVSAQAYAFSGTISFGGHLSQSTSGGVTTNHFLTSPSGWTTNSIPPNTGAYSAVPGLVPTTMTNFSFTGNNTLTPTLIGGPISPQWTFTIGTTTYSFNLEALTSASTIISHGLKSIAETGTGTAFITGQGSSTAVWSLSGVIGAGFTFNAQTAAAGNTPDGGSAVALLGIALAGIEGVRRVIRARKA
jgi:protein with PEP-CTERM/exosortase system signal